MAQVRLLKIASDGVPIEHSLTDDLTLGSFTVNGGGPVLSATGLAMANQDISALKNIVFTDPTVDTINQTAGSLIIDNIMAKDRSNTMASVSDILFPTVSDVSAQVDMFRLPTLAGMPTQAPTKTGEGYMIWDSSNDDLYIWNGSMWDNQNIVKSANGVDDLYTAAASVVVGDVVYLSAADTVSKALATAPVTSQVLGFAASAAAAAGQVNVRKAGKLSGFTGLTAGARYYLDTATAGVVTTTVPSVSGSTICQVGYAKNATTMDILIQQLGRRA